MQKAAFLISCFTIVCSFSCKIPKFKNGEERIKALNSIQQADVDFSNRSKEVGMKKAFLEYMNKDGVLLRPNKMPIVGAMAVDFLSSVNDSTFSLTWHPEGANVAKSADMGYTYGVYTMQMGDSLYKGTYVTIWQKEEDGSWKFLLDTGNEGVDQPRAAE